MIPYFGRKEKREAGRIETESFRLCVVGSGQPGPALHRRTEQANIKMIIAPELSLRGAKRRGNLGKAVAISPGVPCYPAGYCEIAPQGHFLALRAQGATSAYGLLAMTNRGPSAILTIACTGCKCVAGSGMPLPYNFPRDLLLSLYTAAAFFSTAAAVFFRRDLRFRPFCDNIRGRY